MRNISGLKELRAGIAVGMLLLGSQSLWAADPIERVIVAGIDKLEETSKPLLNPNAPEEKEKIKKDPFFDKIRKEQRKFSNKERARRLEFIQKAREKNWDGEKLQTALAGFQKKEMKRRQKFTEKQQKKIQKHQEEMGES